MGKRLDANDVAAAVGAHAAAQMVVDGATPPPPANWPAPLDKAAYNGLPGRVVELFSPHIEADPAALLVQFLVAFGNALGRGAHFRVGASRHYTNLFAVVVGATARARKGLSWDVVQDLFRSVDDIWLYDRVQQGLSSGEGLIWAVRDPEDAVDGKRNPDPGVPDKRLLLVESEFVNVLKQAERSGNILSAVVRQAWDSGTLRTITKNSPARATNAHISIVGHITMPELQRHLAGSVEFDNGFINRFLFVAARRSKLLPEGGYPPEQDIDYIRRIIRSTFDFWRRKGNINIPLDQDATDRWREYYRQRAMSDSGSLLDAVTAREEAQTRRVALLYALTEGRGKVSLADLSAAEAITSYSRRTMQYLFGATTGNPIADDIVSILREADPEGMTKTEVWRALGNYRRKADIDEALTMLQSIGAIAQRQRPSSARRKILEYFPANK